MHYSVLTAISLPETVAIPSADYKQIKFDLLAARAMLKKRPDSYACQMAVAELENSLNPLEYVAENLVFEAMDPYGVNTDNPKYLVFSPHEENEDSAYETETRDCVRLPDGKIVFGYDARFSKRYEIFEGKVYQKRFGPLRHRKRTKKAKKFLPLPAYPLKKLYPTIGAYMEQYLGCTYNEEERAYGYYENPDAFWDWYELGGRWYEYFLVKEDCSSAVRGAQARACGSTKIAPEGYCWVAGARKRDIAWDKMKESFVEEVSQTLQEFQNWCLAGEVPEEWRGFAFVTLDGVYFHRRLVYRVGETVEENLRRNHQLMDSRYFVNPYAFTSGDGWTDCDSFDAGSQGESGDMQWNRKVQEFIDGLPEDAMLVSVDCHN